jgi:putative oxidoreductase
MSAIRTPAKAVRSAWSVIDRVDLVIIPFLRRVAVPLLRVSLGIVFVWFGLLKVFEVSPVALGVFEVTLGVLLLLGRMMRLTLLLFVAQMIGTFLTFLILPNVTFQHGNPLLLTVEGEFVVKNLVLIAAALVVGTTVRRKPGARRRLG